MKQNIDILYVIITQLCFERKNELTILHHKLEIQWKMTAKFSFLIILCSNILIPNLQLLAKILITVKIGREIIFTEFIYMCVCVSLCVYVYIYTYKHLHTYIILLSIHIHVHILILICTSLRSTQWKNLFS